MLRNQPDINKFTVYLSGEYDKNGSLSTRIFNGKNSYCSPMEPKKFINECLLDRGSSLQGAMDSSKKLLGNRNMRPFEFDAHFGIYFIPSKSPSKPDCVWISLMHVINYKSLGRSNTKVYLNFGHTVILEMKESTFKRRLETAQDLRRMISENIGIPIVFYFDPKPTSKLVIKR